MNKLELISALKAEANISKAEAAKVVQIFFDNMADAMARGERVEIRGLCSFFIKEYKSYTGRNPKTGLVEVIELANHPWFVACQFHPEFKSKPDTAHPLFREFIHHSSRKSGRS